MACALTFHIMGTQLNNWTEVVHVLFVNPYGQHRLYYYIIVAAVTHTYLKNKLYICN